MRARQRSRSGRRGRGRRLRLRGGRRAVTGRPPDHSDFSRAGELADEAELERAMAADPEGTLRRRGFLARTAAAAGAASLASVLPAEQLIAAAGNRGKRGKL